MNLRVWLWVLYRGENDSRVKGTWEYKEITLPYGSAGIISDEMVASRSLHHLWLQQENSDQEHSEIERVVVDWYGAKHE